MPSSKTLKQQFVDWSLGRANPAQPTQTWVALLIAAPDQDDTGATISEPTYGEYARQQVPTPAGWTAPADGTPVTTQESTNVNDVVFPEVLTGGGQTVTHYAIVESASGPDRILSYDSTGPLVLNTNVIPQFKAGDLKHQAGDL